MRTLDIVELFVYPFIQVSEAPGNHAIMAWATGQFREQSAMTIPSTLFRASSGFTRPLQILSREQFT